MMFWRITAHKDPSTYHIDPTCHFLRDRPTTTIEVDVVPIDSWNHRIYLQGNYIGLVCSFCLSRGYKAAGPSREAALQEAANPPKVDPPKADLSKALFELLLRYVRHPRPLICRHAVSLDILQLMDDVGAEITVEDERLIKTLMDQPQEPPC